MTSQGRSGSTSVASSTSGSATGAEAGPARRTTTVGSAAAPAGLAALALALLEHVPGGRGGHRAADRVGRRGLLDDRDGGGGADAALLVGQLVLDDVAGRQRPAVDLVGVDVEVVAVLGGEEAEV